MLTKEYVDFMNDAFGLRIHPTKSLAVAASLAGEFLRKNWFGNYVYRPVGDASVKYLQESGRKLDYVYATFIPTPHSQVGFDYNERSTKLTVAQNEVGDIMRMQNECLLPNYSQLLGLRISTSVLRYGTEQSWYLPNYALNQWVKETGSDPNLLDTYKINISSPRELLLVAAKEAQFTYDTLSTVLDYSWKADFAESPLEDVLPEQRIFSYLEAFWDNNLDKLRSLDEEVVDISKI